MRSFTNPSGEKVTVSQEHLDTALLLKKELQDLSTSMRTNWREHKRLMALEGFTDSECNEGYRCMIKAYQASIGELPQKEKFADLVTTNKLESIKSAVGELSFHKRVVQNKTRELGKIKREITDKAIVIEEVSNAFKEAQFNLIEDVYKPRLVSNKNKLLIPISDWHVGVLTETYNYEIANRQIDKYVSDIIDYCKMFNITDVSLAGIGDLIENAYMRSTQASEIEFNLSEQIVKATELVASMISKLAVHLNVEYLGIVMGNHDRLFIKGQTLNNDSAMFVIDEGIKNFIRWSKIERVTIVEGVNNKMDIVHQINGFNVKIVHGDNEAKNDSNKVQKHISSDNVFYDLIVFGHFHHFNVNEENYGRMVTGSGCLQGTTEYSKRLKYNTYASQSIIVFTENEIIPLRIRLDLESL